MSNLNEKSWEIAELALIIKGGKLKSYSTKQLREIMLDVKVGEQIPSKSYNPSGVGNDKHKMMDANRVFCRKFIDSVKDKDKNYKLELLRRIFKNVNNIDNSKNDLELIMGILSAEGVSEEIKEKVKKKIEGIPTKPKSSIKRGREKPYWRNRR